MCGVAPARHAWCFQHLETCAEGGCPLQHLLIHWQRMLAWCGTATVSRLSNGHARWQLPLPLRSFAPTQSLSWPRRYDALIVRGRLRRGHRVLVHSATGAVGLAAARIALSRGCEVRRTLATTLGFAKPYCPRNLALSKNSCSASVMQQ